MTAFLGVEWNAKYTLTGPDGTVAVFNDETDPNFVGILNAESSGLDAAEVREDAAERVEDDGAIFGDFFAGKRPVILQGTVIASSATQRNERVGRLLRASSALSGNAILKWKPQGALEEVEIELRRQQPPRITKGWVKEFQLPMVAEDPRIYGQLQVVTHTQSAPSETSKTVTPSSVATGIAQGGTLSWTNPENAKVSDNAYATISASSGKTKLLTASFTPLIPAEAYINGIEVKVERVSTGSTGLFDTGIWLTAGGTPVSLNRSAGTNWSNVEGVVSFGSPTDSWGLAVGESGVTLPGSLGAAIQAEFLTSREAKVDAISMVIYYTLNGTAYAHTITNEGNASSAPVITMTGPSLKSLLLSNTNFESTQRMEIAKQIAATKILTADMKAKTVTYKTPLTDIYNLVTFSPNSWWKFAPGNNSFSISAAEKIEIAYRNAWM